MGFGRRYVLAALAALLFVPGTGLAQKYPSRPVRIVVGFAPGGATDIAARSIAKRSSVLPDVPTIEEAGLNGYYAASWYGLLMPRGVPRDTVTRLARETGAIVRAPEIRDRMMSQGFEPVGGTPDAFARFIPEEIARWERVVKAAGIKPQ